MQTRIIAVGVIKKGDQYLVGRKAKNVGPYPNTWHILGGGININEETIEEGLIREIKEEAGIDIYNIQKVSFDEDIHPNKYGEVTHYFFLDFVAEYKSGELRAGDDIVEVKWVDHTELKNIPLNKPTKKLFKALKIF